jgi:hypothetical protein
VTGAKLSDAHHEMLTNFSETGRGRSLRSRLASPRLGVSSPRLAWHHDVCARLYPFVAGVVRELLARNERERKCVWHGIFVKNIRPLSRGGKMDKYTLVVALLLGFMDWGHGCRI